MSAGPDKRRGGWGFEPPPSSPPPPNFRRRLMPFRHAPRAPTPRPPSPNLAHTQYFSPTTPDPPHPLKLFSPAYPYRPNPLNLTPPYPLPPLDLLRALNHIPHSTPHQKSDRSCQSAPSQEGYHLHYHNPPLITPLRLSAGYTYNQNSKSTKPESGSKGGRPLQRVIVATMKI